jgi:hypothetical protein
MLCQFSWPYSFLKFVARGSKRLLFHVSHVMLWEFVYALISEIVNRIVTVLIYT